MYGYVLNYFDDAQVDLFKTLSSSQHIFLGNYILPKVIITIVARPKDDCCVELVGLLKYFYSYTQTIEMYKMISYQEL